MDKQWKKEFLDLVLFTKRPASLRCKKAESERKEERGTELVTLNMSLKTYENLEYKMRRIRRTKIVMIPIVTSFC